MSEVKHFCLFCIPNSDLLFWSLIAAFLIRLAQNNNCFSEGSILKSYFPCLLIAKPIWKGKTFINYLEKKLQY